MDTLTRELPARIVADGRTLETRIVPYNVEATVADPPDFRPYRELFTPGAFRKQVSAAHRLNVLLNFEHEQGIRGLIGHATELDDRADGLYGTFRLSRREDGEKARELVEEGLLTGLSVEFHDVTPAKRSGGVVRRFDTRLDKVALCRYPAYEGAEVLAVREQPAVVWEPEPPMDPVLAARLEALGVRVG